MFVACAVTLCIAGVAAAPSPTTLQDVLVASQQAFAAGDFARAASSLRTAQRMAPDIRAVYYNLGTALSRSGDPESAVVTYRNGCRRFPNDPTMHSSLCKAVNSLLNDRQQLGARLPMGRQDMARMCRLAAEMLPDDLDVLTAYGAVLGYNNEAREAAGVFRRMIVQFGGRLDPPALSNAHMNLALTLLNTGGYDEAWTNADQALRLERSPDRLRMAALIRSFCFAGDRLARSLADEALTMATAGTPSHPTYCPSGRWRISRRWGNDAKRNNDIVVTVLGENVHLVFIKKGSISGTGAITTECTVHTGGRQATSVDQHRLSHLATETVQIVDAPLASVLDFFVGNHYHAVIEVLPKLLLLHRYVLSRPEYRDVRLLLPRQGLSRVIDEAVEMIPELRPEIILRCPDDAGHTTVNFRQGLYVIDWDRVPDDDDRFGGDIWSAFLPPRLAIHAVQDFAPSTHVRPATNAAGDIVYVSRRTRTFPNDAELQRFLRKRFGPRINVHDGTGTLVEQMTAYAKAKVVAGIHGAGLSNFVFTGAGAALLEITPDRHVNRCYEHLARMMNRRYLALGHIPGGTMHGDFPAITYDQMRVVADQIASVLDEDGNPLIHEL